MKAEDFWAAQFEPDDRVWATPLTRALTCLGMIPTSALEGMRRRIDRVGKVGPMLEPSAWQNPEFLRLLDRLPVLVDALLATRRRMDDFARPESPRIVVPKP